MMAGFPPAMSRRTGGQQVVEVVVGQRIQPPTTSDEQPADHLGCGGAAGAFGEAEFLRGGQEPGQVVGQRSGRQMSPEDAQFTADQIVIPGAADARPTSRTSRTTWWNGKPLTAKPAARLPTAADWASAASTFARPTEGSRWSIRAGRSTRGMRRAGRPLRDGRGVLC